MIGVFDSGLGGLTVLTALRAQQPDVDVLYVADQAHSPYGSLSDQAVIDRCRRISRWFVEKGAQVIVVACNTATALAIDTLRVEFDVPFVGIEPGIKPAAMHSKTGQVGILATENTVASKRFANLVQAYLPKVTVHSIGCVGLASAIETNPQKALKVLYEHVTPLAKTGIDHLVLGCTHYPLIRDAIEQHFGGQVAIIDTGSAVALEVSRVHRLVRKTHRGNELEARLLLFSTDENNRMVDMISHYQSLHWLKGVPVSHLVI